MKGLISQERKLFHHYLTENNILTINNGIASNADKSSRLSSAIAKHIAEALGAEERRKAEGQTIGANFETACRDFLSSTFLNLQTLRPGKWHIDKLGNKSAIKTSSFVQYEHLEYLENLIKDDTQLATCIGNDYIVAPDIIIYREPEPDNIINHDTEIVSDDCANLASIRKRFNNLPILHASISAKWTIRSDRAQNSRTEALGLIRNRKGHLPHIVVITGEPLPSRLASLALGTGDIDCLYHIALYELLDAVKSVGGEDSLEMLNILVSGKRLKDISDLPLDLSI